MKPTEHAPAPGRRVFLQFPPNYDELSEDDRLAVCRGMAIELQRQLGIVSKPDGSASSRQTDDGLVDKLPDDAGPRLDPAGGPPGEALLGIYASHADLAGLEDELTDE